MSKFLTQDEVQEALEAKYGKVKIHNLNVSVEILEKPKKGKPAASFKDLPNDGETNQKIDPVKAEELEDNTKSK